MKLFISSLYFMWSAEFDLYNTDPVSYTHLTLPTNREV